MLSEGDVKFTATAGATTAKFTVNTDGADSGIVVEGRNVLSFPQFANDILLTAGADARFTDQLNAGVNAVGALTVSTVGPAGDEAVGVVFKTNKERGAMSFDSTGAITMSATAGIEMTGTDSVRTVSTTSLAITSAATSFVGSGSTIAPNGYGLQINSPTQTYTVRGSTDWVSEANFIASGAFVNTAGTNDFVIRSVGDVEIGPNGGGAGPYAISTPFFRASAGRGMQISNALGNVLVASPNMDFYTGTTEDYSAVRVGLSGTNNRIVTDSTVAGSADNTVFRADNNILLTGNSDMDWTTNGANSAIRFTATKGDILFRSTSTNIPGNHDVTVSSTNGDVYITAFHRIDHRQHQRLSFFNTDGQRARTGPNTVTQQPTTNIMNNLQVRLANPLRLNDCVCNQGFCSNIECPETTNRVLQMQEALVSYGLLTFA